MSERKIEQIADSAYLRLAVFAITAIFLPFSSYVGVKVLDRLETVEKAVGASSVQSATFELRVQALEKAGIERQAAIRVLTEQSLKHDYELRRLDDRVSSANGRAMR